MDAIVPIINALSIVIIFIAIYVALLYTAIKILSLVFKWISHRAWVRKQVIKIQKKYQHYRDIFKPYLLLLWEFYAVNISSLALWGWAVYVINDKFQYISELNNQNPGYGISRLLDADMKENPWIWIGFSIVLILWWMSNTWKTARNWKFERDIRNSISNIEKSLGIALQKDIGSINNNITNELKKIKDNKSYSRNARI